MRKKKRTRGKKSKNKTARGRKGRKKRVGAKKAAGTKRMARRKKTARARKATRRKKTVRRKKPAPRRRLPPNWAAPEEKGPGPVTAGQSGDIQGLSGVASVDSESVAELAEEGQAFEAEVVSGVESAPDADVREVTTKEVPEDDVPPEYRERE